MTTRSVDRPVSVEPMTDAELTAEREAMALAAGRGTWPADIVARLFATIDALKARALPLPRRYTGGPLEDGLYLWRRPWWHATSWAAFAVEGGRRHAFMGPTLYSTEAVDVWIIGPIHIPEIPSEDASP
ncbi:MAG: hypothetical protein IPK85_01915 [Gemmatimonadetes bacterium]|nr:hypothetical protein [Gemmatimonadota bacterium]